MAQTEKVFKEGKEVDPSGTSSEPEGGKEGEAKSSPSTDPTSNPSSTGIESPFKGTAFEGKTVQEIEVMLKTRDAALAEVQSQANKLHSELSQLRVSPGTTTQPGGIEEDDGYSAEEMWTDPDKGFKKLENRVAEKILREMREMITPFQEDLNRTRASTALTRIKDEKSNFSQYEPLIRTILSGWGQDINATTYDYLKAAYTMAVGMVASGDAQLTGVQSNNRDEPVRSTREPPPQHHPSTQPMSGGEETTKVRELTENERRLARERGMTPEQYLKLQEKLDYDVPIKQS